MSSHQPLSHDLLHGVPLCRCRRLFGARDNDTEEYRRYFKFVEVVANATFASLDAFKEFKGDPELNKVDQLDLADRVSAALAELAALPRKGREFSRRSPLTGCSVHAPNFHTLRLDR